MDPESARIVEVFPRDGLQALGRDEIARLPTDAKAAVIEDLARCGVPEIEVTGFAHPDRVPATADAERLLARLGQRPGVTYRALVPNRRGLDRALSAGVAKTAFFLVCSETYQAKNVGMTVHENLRVIAELKPVADAAGVKSCVSVGTAFICPYEGPIAPQRVIEIVEVLYDMGFREIGIADSIGMAGPRAVRDLCAQLRARHPDVEHGLHLHDRHGLGLANVLAALGAGVTRFESSMLGIGAGIAMPVPQRTMGNIATETAVLMLEELGIHTGIDLQALCEISRRLAKELAITDMPPVVENGTFQELLGASKERRRHVQTP